MLTIKHTRRYSKVDGPCLYNQTLCNDGGLTIKGCRLCQPYTQGKGPNNYPVPALYFNRAYVRIEGMKLVYNPRSPWWLSR